MHTKRVVLITVAIAIVLGAGFVWYAIESTKKIESGQGVVTVSWLPTAATDISYYRSYGWTAYEFEISEEGFREWASKYPLKEIDDTVYMERWSWLDFSQESSHLPTEEYQSLRLSHLTSIENGLFGGISWENGGRELAAFDRKLGRAYFQSNPR
jgi:hypothetical protein